MTAPIYKRQEMVTVAHIAERWAISKRSVYMMIETGKLTAFQFGGSLRVHISEMLAFEENSKYDAGA